MKETAKNGFSLIELLIVTVIGLFVLQAAYLLYTGSAKLFKDVKATSDNIQTKVPAVELMSRFFDRWGVAVYTSGSANCASYPPSDAKCITVVTGTPCDEVSFWGGFHGSGFVASVTGTTASIVSCRLSKTASNNCHYLWRNDVLQNTLDPTLADPYNKVVHLALNNNLSVNNADCSGITAASPTNATVESTLVPWSGAVDKVLQAGDVIHRAPHKVRLYCALNASDNNQRWLYADLADTAGECNGNETASPIAPVDSFKVNLLPAACNATTGGCRAATITMVLRSQAKSFSGSYKTETVVKTFGR